MKKRFDDSFAFAESVDGDQNPISVPVRAVFPGVLDVKNRHWIALKIQ
jgi:hypothetical protein